MPAIAPLGNHLAVKDLREVKGEKNAMQITNKSFTTRSLETEPAASQPAADSTAAAAETEAPTPWDELFDIPEGSTTSTAAAGVNGYTMGDFVSETGGGEEASADGLDWLREFPPTLETIMTNDDKAIAYLDTINGRFEQAIGDLHSLKIAYINGKDTGTISQRRNLTTRIELVEQAIARATAEQLKTQTFMKSQEAIYAQEMARGADYNNDNWIGQPYLSSSYFVKVNDDGTRVIIDPVSRKPVSDPVFKGSDYSPRLVGAGLDLIDDPNLAANYTELNDDELEKYQAKFDLFLKLDGSDASNNAFGCPVVLGVPDAIWVKKGERNADGGMAIAMNDSNTRAAIYNDFVKDGGGIIQNSPNDISNYMQVPVSRMELSSEESGLKSGDQPLYHQVVKLYTVVDGTETLLMTMRIEGQVGGGNGTAAATDKAGDNYNYIAASSVGLAIDGKANKSSPESDDPDIRQRDVQIDAGRLLSTGKHTCAEIASQLGEGIAEAKSKNSKAYDETLGLFDDSDGDTFMATDLPANSTVNHQTDRTGIFFKDVRGDIKGTNYNDVFKLSDADPSIDPSAGSYHNFADGNGGTNVFILGSGHNHIRSASFVWGDSEHVKSTDMNTIELVRPFSRTEGEGADKKYNLKNPPAFVMVDGGSECYVDNPDETDIVKVNEQVANDQPPNEEYKTDDYIHVTSSSKWFTDPDDSDIDDASRNGAKGTPTGNTFFAPAWEEAYSIWKEDFLKKPDLMGAGIDSNWDDVIGSKTELDTEMNGFFDELFGGSLGEAGNMEEMINDPTSGVEA